MLPPAPVRPAVCAILAARVLVVDPLTDPRWTDLCRRAGGATIFEHPAWMALLHRQYGYAITAWCVPAADGLTLAAGLPVALVASRLTGTRLVALPFSDTCAVLADPADPGARARLGAAAAARRDALGLDLEVRGPLVGAPGAHRSSGHVVHRLDLTPGADAVAKGFGSQIRRGVKKAAREGVTVERRTDADALARFFALHVRTRRDQGVPTQPRRFVLRFADLFAQGLGFVALARHEGRDAAAAVFLRAGTTLTYKYGASDRELLGVRPNNALFADAIAHGCDAGLHTLDFGRTDLANEGLRAFKRSWGAEETELAYTTLAAHPPGPGPGRAERALAVAIRRSHPLLGRLVGEALYRHVG